MISIPITRPRSQRADTHQFHDKPMHAVVEDRDFAFPDDEDHHSTPVGRIYDSQTKNGHGAYLRQNPDLQVGGRSVNRHWEGPITLWWCASSRHTE